VELSRGSSRLVGLFDALGYDAARREADYPVWLGPAVFNLDLVAFGVKEPRDMTTATIAAVTANGDTTGLSARF
jgi:hypothetical protein